MSLEKLFIMNTDKIFSAWCHEANLSLKYTFRHTYKLQMKKYSYFYIYWLEFPHVNLQYKQSIPYSTYRYNQGCP